MDKMLYVIAHLTNAILELLDAGVITADYAEVARQLCFVSPKIANVCGSLSSPIGFTKAA